MRPSIYTDSTTIAEKPVDVNYYRIYTAVHTEVGTYLKEAYDGAL